MIDDDLSLTSEEREAIRDAQRPAAPFPNDEELLREIARLVQEARVMRLRLRVVLVLLVANALCELLRQLV